MANIHTRPYTPDQTESPLTDAYLQRARRRDDPHDYGVCRHNVLVQHDPTACTECSRG